MPSTPASGRWWCWGVWTAAAAAAASAVASSDDATLTLPSLRGVASMRGAWHTGRAQARPRTPCKAAWWHRKFVGAAASQGPHQRGPTSEPPIPLGACRARFARVRARSRAASPAARDGDPLPVKMRSWVLCASGPRSDSAVAAFGPMVEDSGTELRTSVLGLGQMLWEEGAAPCSPPGVWVTSD